MRPEDLAARLPALPRWLDGTGAPTLKQLEDFAAATAAPIGYLFLPEPPVERIPIPDMRTVASARVRSPSPDLLDTLYLCQQRQDWYREYAQVTSLRPLGFVGSLTLDVGPEEAAGEMRTALGFDRDAVAGWETAFRVLADRAEQLGVLVMRNGVVGVNTHRRPWTSDDEAVRFDFFVLRPAIHVDLVEDGSPVATDPGAMPNGTAFHAGAPGYFLTNAHVVDDTSGIALYRAVDERSVMCAAEVVQTDPANDLALLRADGGCFPQLGLGGPLPLGSTATVGLGTPVVTLGYPMTTLHGMRPQLSDGYVRGDSGQRGDVRELTVSNTFLPGNSGGPLVGPSGTVVGVVVARLDDRALMDSIGQAAGSNIGYAIKADLAAAFLAAAGVVPKGSTPVVGKDLAERAKSLATRVVMVVVESSAPPVVGSAERPFREVPASTVFTGRFQLTPAPPASVGTWRVWIEPELGALKIDLACPDATGTSVARDGWNLVSLSTPRGLAGCTAFIGGDHPMRVRISSEAPELCYVVGTAASCGSSP